jgi:hypothetical protein
VSTGGAARIAIIGWGSLIWDPRNLSFDRVRNWESGGPILPLEFSRKSSDGRLTIVLDEEYGVAVATRVATSDLGSVDLAVKNLASREGVSSDFQIGHIDVTSGNGRSRIKDLSEIIARWGSAAGYTHAIWTDLPPMKGFTLEWAIEYLDTLRGTDLKKAREYIRRAPEEVETPLRMALRQRGWLGRE